MDNNVMNIRNENITGDKLLGVTEAFGDLGIRFVDMGGHWVIQSAAPIKGFDLARTYTSRTEANTFLVGYLLHNGAYQGVLRAA